MSNFKKFVNRFTLAAIKVATFTMYGLTILISVPFLIYGSWFVLAGFSWLVVFAAAFYSAVIILVLNFFMVFAALFDATLWQTMGDMWTWVANWFVGGSVYLWPHLAKSFLPYLGWGLLFLLVMQAIEAIKKRTAILKLL